MNELVSSINKNLTKTLDNASELVSSTKTSLTQQAGKLNQSAQKTVKLVQDKAKSIFASMQSTVSETLTESQEKLSKTSKEIKQFSKDEKAKAIKVFNNVKGFFKSKIDELTGQKTGYQKLDSQELTDETDETVNQKEDQPSLLDHAQRKIKDLKNRITPNNEKLKSTIQKTKNSIHNLLFFHDDMNASSKPVFRFFFKGAVQTINITLYQKLFSSTIKAKVEKAQGKIPEEMDVKSQKITEQKEKLKTIGKIALLEVASRLLLAVATPIEVLKAIALMPLNIKKAIQSAHLDKRIKFIKKINQSESQKLFFKTTAKIYTLVSLTALKNIGLVLISPVRMAVLGTVFLITGVRKLSIQSASIQKTAARATTKLAAQDITKDKMRTRRGTLKDLQQRKPSRSG